MKRAEQKPITLTDSEKLRRRCGTIGSLEELAGLPRDEQSRFNFWVQFNHHEDVIDAGVARLRLMVLERVDRGELCLI
ncbi:hypothetical protein [Burkholderia pseudomallei]|uniref:hypothetical protein n=1 Tax=Burkholderia pseudomallei TaxID=28450 RepID=UPI0012F4CCE2|nr:hypothetical protein [Burkholderia pseudomallei]